MSECLDVSVIVVNYNSSALLINAVNSLFEQTKDLSYEVIVVDNASPDGSGLEISKYFGQKIQFIQSEVNIGFGRANNLALEIAKGSYVFLLNPDTLILNNALWYFVDFAKNNIDKYKIGALGSMLLDEKKNKINSYSVFPTIKVVLSYSLRTFFSFFKERTSIAKYSEIKEPFLVDFISGADLFIPMKVLKKTGYFDPRFFMYCEETDLQKRMEEVDLERIIISGPEIIHFDGGTFDKSKRKSNNRRIMQDSGLLIYLKKYNSKLSYFIFRLFFFVFRFPAVLNPHYTKKENYEFLRNLVR